jgi:hypothetical protein
VNSASWAVGPGYNDQATEIFLAALNLMIGDEKSAKAEARSCGTVQRWHEQLQVRTCTAAFGTSLIPGLHGGGIALELPYLLRLMGRGAIGTGELMNAKIEAEADLLAIFALWSGAINKSALAAAAGGVVIVDSIAYPAFGAKVLAVGFKIGVKAASNHAGTRVAAGAAIGHAAGKASNILQPIFGKILAKIAAKISAKVAAHAYAKALVGLVPFLGACVSTGISWYILREFLTSTRIYYEHKNRDVGTRLA